VTSIAIAAGMMSGLAITLGVILAVAWRLLRVEEDPRIERVEELLPGTNCGACGTPGCRAFAEALVGGDVQPAGCTVAAPADVSAVAAFLGVAAGERPDRVARLKCAGGRSQALQIAAYRGLQSCRAAAAVSGGGKGCSWGCLGLADCERACGFDAIGMNTDSLPVVDIDLCTACGDCVEACPKDLFALQPLSRPLLVQCASPLAGDEALALCTVACDACGRCALDAPTGLIEMVGNLPVIKPENWQPGAAAATRRCPTGAIAWVPGGQLGAPSVELRRGSRAG